MKKIFIVFILCASLIFPNNIYADEEGNIFESMQNDSFVLLDMDSGQVLLESNMSSKIPIEGVTNLMTGIMAVENLDLSKKITATENVVKVKGTKVYIQEDEEILGSDLLKANLVYSANDAALALAEAMAGSDEKFVKKMNEKAKEIGCQNTNFTNSYGLKDSRHISTAYDLSLIAQYAMKNDTFREYAKIKTFNWSGISWQAILGNKNKLLDEYDGISGIMSGTKGNQEFLDLVVSFEKGNNNYVLVILNGRIDTVFVDATKIIEYAQKNFKKQTILNKSEALVTVKIDEETTLKGISAQAKSIAIKGDSPKDFTKEVVLFDLDRTIELGEKIGEVVISQSGQEIDRIDILADKEVSRGFNYFAIIMYSLAVLYLIQIAYRISKTRRKRTRR